MSPCQCEQSPARCRRLRPEPAEAGHGTEAPGQPRASEEALKRTNNYRESPDYAWLTLLWTYISILYQWLLQWALNKQIHKPSTNKYIKRRYLLMINISSWCLVKSELKTHKSRHKSRKKEAKQNYYQLYSRQAQQNNLMLSWQTIKKSGWFDSGPVLHYCLQQDRSQGRTGKQFAMTGPAKPGNAWLWVLTGRCLLPSLRIFQLKQTRDIFNINCLLVVFE